MAMSAESSVFTIIAASTVLATHVAAIVAAPATIASHLIPIGLAIKWGAWPAWNMISSVKIIKRLFKKKPKAAKVEKAAAPSSPAPTLQPAPAPVAAQTAADQTLPAKPLTDAFEKAAAKMESGMLLRKELPVKHNSNPPEKLKA